MRTEVRSAGIRRETIGTRDTGRGVRRIARHILYKAVVSMFRLLWRWNRGKILGVLPEESFVLVANHGSYLDWIMLDIIVSVHLQRDIVFLAKDKVAQSRFWGPLARERQAVIVKDTCRSRAGVQLTRLFEMSRSRIVAIFPEGTRSRSGTMLPAHRGAAWLARKAGVRMVPVALHGFWKVWPPTAWLPSLRRYGLAIEFLDPLDPHNYATDQACIDAAMQSIYSTLEHTDNVERVA